MEPSNSERREILRRQHDELRRDIAAARLAALFALSDGGTSDGLFPAVEALERDLLAHLVDEERLLGPILAGIDAWGPVRLERLRTEHARQRAVLATLNRRSVPLRAVASRTLALCEDLLADMDFEETELFSEKVMRDDCILLDASDA
jgi:hypothetical protein